MPALMIMRVHSEQVLLRLGATSVIYREIGFSRLLRMIDESRALVHAREVETDCAAALRGQLPVHKGDKVCFVISGGSVALEQLHRLEDVRL